MKDFNLFRRGAIGMNVDKYPKSIKKAVRYIKQDATKEQLEDIKKLIDYAIKKRTASLI